MPIGRSAPHQEAAALRLLTVAIKKRSRRFAFSPRRIGKWPRHTARAYADAHHAVASLLKTAPAPRGAHRYVRGPHW